MGSLTNPTTKQSLFNWINIQPNKYQNIHTNYIIDHQRIQIPYLSSITYSHHNYIPHTYYNKSNNKNIYLNHTYTYTHTSKQINNNIDNNNTQIFLLSYNKRLQIKKSNVVQLIYYTTTNTKQDICNSKYQVNAIDVYIQGNLIHFYDVINRKSIKQYNNNINNNNNANNNNNTNNNTNINHHQHQHHINNQKTKNICFCKQIIKGFENLKQIYGPFEVTNDMIWYDQNNQIKVWFNKNPFLNTYKNIRQSLMVMQIRQILYQFGCNCNYFQVQQLGFNFNCFKNINGKFNKNIGNLGNKSFNVSNSQGNNSFNLNINLNRSNNNIQNDKLRLYKSNQKIINVQQRAISPQSPQISKTKFNFYYPPTILHNKNHHKKLKTQVQQIQTMRYGRTQPLSKTQKITFTHQATQNSINSQPKIPLQYQNNQNQSQLQKQTQSRIIPSNTKCSTPKVNFNYENQSMRGTPTKISNFIKPESEITSPSQNSGMRSSQVPHSFFHGINAENKQKKILKKVPYFKDNSTQNHNKTFEDTKNKDISFIYKKASLNHKNDIIRDQNKSKKKVIPFQVLQNQKYNKNKSLPLTTNTNINKLEKNQNLLLPQVKEQQNSSQVSIQQMQAIKRQIMYQNSYTDRQINESLKMFSRPRNSVQSQKLQGKVAEIQYEVPQKTRKLIQKYLHNRKDSEQANSQKLPIQTENQKQKMNKNNNNNKIIKLSRESIDQEQQFAKTEHLELSNSQQIKDKTKQQDLQFTLSQVNMQRAISCNEATTNNLQKYERQKLKKQMEKIFNYSPQDQEQNIIRKKVAQKKAIFADLKAEASKILQNKQHKITK